MNGQVGAYLGCVVLGLVGLALAHLGRSRHRDNPGNPLWLFTAVTGLLAALGFLVLLVVAIASRGD